jgi:uncharacterized glyoxalase superfamily protein PhnB
MGVISPLMAVRDMKQTIDFYRNSLGFKVGMMFPDANKPEYADLSKDDMVLMIIPVESMGIGHREKLGTGINLYLQIDDDIDEYYHELKNKKVKVVTEVKDEPWGSRDFTVADINGYLLTFSQVSKTSKICMSCGMPLAKPEDFGGGNPESLYCVHCSKPDGSLKSYEEVFAGMTNFMMTNQNMNKETAEQAAKEYLAKMPAWGGEV